MVRKTILSRALLLCIAFFLISSANAQQTLGSLNGTVTDSSGAAISAVDLTVSDSDIGVTRSVKAGNNGSYQIFNLPVGRYTVQAIHAGFETTKLVGLDVREAQTTTVNVTMKIGHEETSVEVTANPMLNATDTTNGYTMDGQQIEETPLATGSFTQLATLSPGVSAELLSSVDTNAGLGNQPIWANGQRDTSNTFQVNGVDSTNIFNGKTSSNSSSQRYQFNIGQASAIGGETQTSGTVFGSNGNSLPTPPPQFLQELRVNASQYDAQQGMTSGAQIDANTRSGTNSYHGQVYGSFANNDLNAAPFFFKQNALLGTGGFPANLANPALHRWTAGGTLGGPIKKDKLFLFVAYQHLYSSDQSTGLSRFNVPTGLTNDRSAAGLTAMEMAYNGGKLPTGFALDPTGVAQAIFNATVPGGGYLIPTPSSSAAYQSGVPNVTVEGTSRLLGDQAAASVDYDVTHRDRLSFKYYYQNDPLTRPFGVQSTLAGFPGNTYNAAQVGALDNTISIGTRLNWEQRLGYSRTATYSSYNQTVVNNSGTGANFGITNPVPGVPNVMPALSIQEIAASSGTPTLSWGPQSTFTNTGYFQNRLNPSTNAIYQLGKHTIFAGGGYSYTQLNIQNNRNGLISASASSLTNFLEGSMRSSSVLETVGDGRNLANRYYRTNEGDGYVQDQWRILSNLTLTGGVRWDYHGGFTEKYGNFFNFDPNLYNVTGTDPGVGGSGFTVNNDGLVVAGNNPTAPTPGTSASTLSGRQWGLSPRVGFAWSPKRDNGKLVVRGGFGLYYDRGELFTYLSPPAGGSVGGPFGVTQQSPLVAAVSGVASKTQPLTTQNPLGSAGVLTSNTTPPAPGVNPAIQQKALQNQLNYMTASTSNFGLNCGGVGNLEDMCLQTPLYLGAYDKNNVLPYTMNYSFNVQWQPRADLAVTLGYSGNRSRHSVIPIPFNEPQIATPGSPAMIGGASPHSSNEIYSYGYDVMNGDRTCGTEGDPCPIAPEPWSTYDGGNSDFRVAFPGYSPYSALFETVGNSAYDALETHIEKRMTHNIQFGGSYTWGHALDEQSDLGLFFTGNDPAHLKNSYASADFDRTNIFAGNFVAKLPNAIKDRRALGLLTNDWSLSGIATLQSGQPYSLYEFNGAVGSAQLGYFPSLINPILPIANPKNPQSALTGNSGRFRGPGGSYIPAIDPSQIQLQYLTPGQGGVPAASAGGATDPVDAYETAFSSVNQRNIFRQAPQESLQLSLRKQFRVSERFNLGYGFNMFNATNHTSMDVPQNGVQIAQHGACANTLPSSNAFDCSHGFENFGMVITDRTDQSMAPGRTGAPVNGGTAGGSLYRLPIQTGTGKSTMVPTAGNNAATFGSVTTAIGSARIITMDLRLVF